MTSALVSSIETYTFSATDKLFLDANVCLMLEPPGFRPAGPEHAVYTAAFKRMLQAKSKLFVDVVVLSEVVNRWLRYAWDAVDPPPHAAYPNFKAFRLGLHGSRPAKDVGAACRRLLRNARVADTGFHSRPVDDVLADVETATRDFNDAVIAQTCVLRGFTLITHDADFRGARATILTANRRLLRR